MKMKFRSAEILSKDLYPENRALFKSMGLSDDDMKGPIIGIANSWNELVAGHHNLRDVADAVRRGVYRAGGTPVEFGVIAGCDAMGTGYDGASYFLPTRDFIANDIEAMVRSHPIDGLVMLGSCDKIVPGMLMAAVRLNIPAIVAVGGPMLGGAEFDGRQSDSTSLTEALGMLQAGRTDRAALARLEDTAAPCCGSCSFYGTANSMGCVAEALGMSLPGTALIPAVYAARMRTSQDVGMKIVDLVRRDIRPRQIVDIRSLENAVSLLMATGGSTNCLIHLSAIAHEAGIPAEAMTTLYDEASERTPCIARVNPASRYNMEDFHKAGGVQQVLIELGPAIHRNCLTVSGETVDRNLETWRNPYPANEAVIRSTKNPFSTSKGLAVLRGNLAPDTAIAKPAAMDPEMYRFSGPARVFDGEEEANRYILEGRVREGDVLVVRYEGPRGGPGMREMYYAMKLLYGLGLGKKTALVTDGRFSGTNNGCFVGHISPEAAAGGPIAIVEDGDIIRIDIEKKTLVLDLPQGEIDRRLAAWRRPEPKVKSGCLALYAAHAASAAEGAMMKLSF